VLFEIVFSPGTGTTVTFTVTGAPARGGDLSGMSIVLDPPAGLRAIDLVSSIGAPAPVIETLTGTSLSAFWPWLRTLTVNAGLVPAVTRFVAPPAVSAVPPTATEVRACPWEPGAALPRLAPAAVPPVSRAFT